MLDSYLPFSHPHFQYAGISRIGFAFGITMFAYNLDFEFLNNSTKKFVSDVTNFTQGIYCSHNLICTILYGIISVYVQGKTGKFYQCVLIYILCYLMCWVVNKIPCKWKKI